MLTKPLPREAGREAGMAPLEPRRDNRVYSIPFHRAGKRERSPGPRDTGSTPGSCALPTTESRVPSPKCSGWLFHSATRVWKTPEMLVWGSAFQKLASTQNSRELCSPHSLSLFPALFLVPGPSQTSSWNSDLTTQGCLSLTQNRELGSTAEE